MSFWDWLLTCGIAVVVIITVLATICAIAMLTDKEDYIAKWWSRGTHQGRYKRDDD